MRGSDVSRVNPKDVPSPRWARHRSARPLVGYRHAWVRKGACWWATLGVIGAGLQCTTESEPEEAGVPALCERVVACLEGTEGTAPAYAASECVATAARLGELAELLGASPEPLAASICDSDDPCADTFCRVELATTIRQWQCEDQPVSGDCTCVARLIGPSSPLSFGAANVCQASECCFALSAFPGAPARRPVTGCGCIGGVDAQSCAEALAGDPELVQIDSCPPRLECAPEGEACDAEACCSGLSCRAEGADLPRCRSVSQAEGWQLACEALASNRAFEGMIVASGSLRTNVGPLEFDRVSYSVLETGENGCLQNLRLSLADEQDSSDCRLSLDVESRGADLVVTYAAGFLGGCPGYSGGLLNDLYFGGMNSGIQVSFDGSTCAGPQPNSFCISGRFEFRLSGPSGNTPEQALTFTDSIIVVEGAGCGDISFAPCESTPLPE
jgi:hypothetical protein